MKNLIAIASCLLVAACGAGAETEPAVLRASPLVLTTPPVVFHVGQHQGVSYRADWEAGSIEIAPFDPMESIFTIVLPGEARVLLVESQVIDDDPTLLIGAVDSSEVFTLYALSDSGSDGIVDASTLVALLDTGSTPAYITDIEIVGTAWFLLDRRCQDIWVALAGAGGVPSSIESTAFAMSQNHSDLLSARRLFGGLPNGVRASFQAYLLADPVSYTHLDMPDANGDQLADSVTSVDRLSTPNPRVRGAPFAGQAQISLDPGTEIGSTGEVWLLDAQGQDVQLLGSVLLAVSGWTDVALSPSLAIDESVGVRFSGSLAAQKVWVVEADHPQILDLDVERILTGQSQSQFLVATGVSFAQDMVVTLVFSEVDEEYAVALSNVTTTSATLSVPVLPVFPPESAEGGACLVVKAFDADEEDPISIVPISICQPDE